jgi:hypothetical protein
MRSRFAGAVRSLVRQVRSSSIVERSEDCSDTVFLSSGARTGSTWVSDVINYRNEYRYMFEPFTVASALGPLHGQELPWDTPLNYLQYIRPDCDDPDLIEQARLVLSGRLRHPLVDQYNRKIIVSRRLIKEVKSNLWIKWLKAHFPTIPIVLLLRHPIPTIRSRWRRYFDAAPEDRRALDPDPEKRYSQYMQMVFEQQHLTDDHLREFQSALEQARSVVAQRAAVWCIQNIVPLRQFAKGEVHLVFYENFCVEPEAEMRRLAGFLGVEVDDSRLRSYLSRMHRPSPTAGNRTLPDPSAIVSGWQKKTTSEELDDAMRMLEAFGLDKIYGRDAMPNAVAAEDMLS